MEKKNLLPKTSESNVDFDFRIKIKKTQLEVAKYLREKHLDRLNADSKQFSNRKSA
jgi:hypothetical protein